MAQQGMPNPIELYEGAVHNMLPILGGIKESQLNDPSPCTEWNVQSLMNHQIKVAQYLHTEITGVGTPDPSSMFAVDGPLPAGGIVAAFEEATKAVLDAAKVPGTLEKVVNTGRGEMPAGRFMMGPFSDILIHKWDLAKATNQDLSIDSALAEVSYNGLSQAIEGARKGGFFGPEVQVAISASVQDKLLGISGRKP